MNFCAVYFPADKQDSLAEWSKALASGASPQGRGFEPHSCHVIEWSIPLNEQRIVMKSNNKQNDARMGAPERALVRKGAEGDNSGGANVDSRGRQ